jgi:hypothetical protein
VSRTGAAGLTEQIAVLAAIRAAIHRNDAIARLDLGACGGTVGEDDLDESTIDARPGEHSDANCDFVVADLSVFQLRDGRGLKA